jgi:iron complex outermembrane receptor protein
VGAGGSANSAASSSNLTQSGTESFAGYGQTTLFLLDNLELTMGVRYSREEKPASERRGADPSLNVNLSQVWTAWTPRMEFTWRVTDTSHLTIGAARGFKPGGFNLNSLSNLDFRACAAFFNEFGIVCPLLQFNEETVWQYQLLSKNVLFDDTLDLNLTLFWTRYSNYQACQITANGFLCNSGGDALLRGVEVETKWEPITGLRINANFDYLDTSVDKFRIIDPTQRPGTPGFAKEVDISGNRLPRSPPFAVNTGIQYEFELGRYGFLTPRAQFRWQDKTYFRVFNAFDKNDKYYWADVKLSWRSEDERWSLEGELQNITDVDVVNNILIGPDAAGAPVLAFYRPPRRWSIKAGWRW